jgi:hypothetical protein
LFINVFVFKRENKSEKEKELWNKAYISCQSQFSMASKASSEIGASGIQIRLLNKDEHQKTKHGYMLH